MENGIDNGATRVAEHVSATVRREEANYRVGHERPLGGYLGVC